MIIDYSKIPPQGSDRFSITFIVSILLIFSVCLIFYIFRRKFDNKTLNYMKYSDFDSLVLLMPPILFILSFILNAGNNLYINVTLAVIFTFMLYFSYIYEYRLKKFRGLFFSLSITLSVLLFPSLLIALVIAFSLYLSFSFYEGFEKPAIVNKIFAIVIFLSILMIIFHPAALSVGELYINNAGDYGSVEYNGNTKIIVKNSGDLDEIEVIDGKKAIMSRLEDPEAGDKIDVSELFEGDGFKVIGVINERKKIIGDYNYRQIEGTSYAGDYGIVEYNGNDKIIVKNPQHMGKVKIKDSNLKTISILEDPEAGDKIDVSEVSEGEVFKVIGIINERKKSLNWYTKKVIDNSKSGIKDSSYDYGDVRYFNSSEMVMVMDANGDVKYSSEIVMVMDAKDLDKVKIVYDGEVFKQLSSPRSGQKLDASKIPNGKNFQLIGVIKGKEKVLNSYEKE